MTSENKSGLINSYDIDLVSLSKLIISIFRLNGRIIEWGDLLGAPLGLTSARWQILGAVKLSGKALTAPLISRIMGITRQGAQKQLNVLLAEGLIKQLPNPRHDRSYLYELTAKGKDTLEKMDSVYAFWCKEVTAGLSAKALNEAQELLDHMVGNIEDIVIHKNGKARLRSESMGGDEDAQRH